MTGMLLQLGATVLCAHAGQTQIAPGSARVRLSGAPAVTIAHAATIAGCPFNVSGSPSPCVTGQWTSAATRVRIEGAPAVLSTSTGLGIGPAPQGPLQVTVTQTRVRGQ